MCSMNPRRLPIISLVLFLFSCFQLNASSVFGLVRDTQGNPVAGASVYVSEIRAGASTNSEGYYQVPLVPGTYHLHFQALGFEKREFRVTIPEHHDEELDVELQEVTFQIREVRVYSGGEDPAYAMMRKAIGLAPYSMRSEERRVGKSVDHGVR